MFPSDFSLKKTKLESEKVCGESVIQIGPLRSTNISATAENLPKYSKNHLTESISIFDNKFLETGNYFCIAFSFDCERSFQ